MRRGARLGATARRRARSAAPAPAPRARARARACARARRRPPRTMGASPPEMRIDVAPDGHVQLAVSLSHSFDPTLVASVVAAVRHGIVQQPPADRASAPPPVSVRERVRQLDAGVDREFASSPALRAARRAPPPHVYQRRRLSERTNSLPAQPDAPAERDAVDERDAQPASLPSSRSLSDLTDDSPRPSPRAPRAAVEDGVAVVPSSPYVGADTLGADAADADEEQQQPRQHTHDDVDDAWDTVEYVATDEYERQIERARIATRRDHLWDARGRAVPLRPNAWRLLASFASLRQKRAPFDPALHSTLASAAPSAAPERKPSGKRVRARTLFSRGNDAPLGDWMEFSSSVGVERILAEVGNIVKSLEYDVWRRAGENKLRCIRSISESHQMHVVIVVGGLAVPGKSLSVVRLRRARGDRNKTELWRFQVLFRELVHRLRANGVDVRSEQP
ncbi:hypothetical protein FGB62_373g04 [Gracilaria domingensis]|nr:hypothetical protein FGB62_373g04 [Gracilaria domingensis]